MSPVLCRFFFLLLSCILIGVAPAHAAPVLMISIH